MAKGRPKKNFTKEQILMAMRHTKSNRAAARYLQTGYQHYKKWAKFYHVEEGGQSLFEAHLNRSGKGIPKFINKSKFDILDVIEGRISVKHFKPEEIKAKMIEGGYLKEECAICGFHERRISDYKVPLILNFKDNDPNHYNLGNIRFLCYNCFYLQIGDIFTKNDVIQLETHETKNFTSEAIDFQLDDYQKKRLEELGLYEPPKPDDGSEFISRL